MCQSTGGVREPGRSSQSISAAMMSGSSVGCAQVAAASFTAGGTETLSVSREAGHAGLTRFNPVRLALSSRLGLSRPQILNVFRYDPVHSAILDLIRPSKSEVRNPSHASIVSGLRCMRSSAQRRSQRAGVKIPSAPIATATNKLSHRLSTLPVAEFSANSNVKCRAQPARRGGRIISEFRRDPVFTSQRVEFGGASPKFPGNLQRTLYRKFFHSENK